MYTADMKRFIILSAFVSIVTANVIPEDAQAKTLQYENWNDGSGNYKFSYDTSNGIFRSEIGRLVNAGEENEHIVVEGTYSYTNPDGKFVYVTYTADENGYRLSKPEYVPGVTYSLPANVVATLLG